MKASGGHSGKTEQEKDILERQNKKRTFWKDRTRKGHSGKTEQEKDILERQNNFPRISTDSDRLSIADALRQVFPTVFSSQKTQQIDRQNGQQNGHPQRGHPSNLHPTFQHLATEKAISVLANRKRIREGRQRLRLRKRIREGRQPLRLRFNVHLPHQRNKTKEQPLAETLQQSQGHISRVLALTVRLIRPERPIDDNHTFSKQ